jgi:hypothetical protein
MTDKYTHLTNLAMQALLNTGEALDVSQCEKTPEGWYKLPAGLMDVAGDVDLCVVPTETWINSVGKNLTTGEVFASIHGNFYPAKNGWECVWLR